MMKLKLVSKIGKLIVLHTFFWIVAWWFFIYFFSFNSSNTSYVHWFSNVLLPIAILNTYFTNYYLIPKYLISKKYKRFISYQIYTIIVTAYFLSIIMFIGYVFLTPLDFEQMPLLSKSLPFILLIVYTVVLVVSSANIMHYNYKALEQNKLLEKQILEGKLKLKEEELKFLKMQIHPHFLFNTLNTLYGFALKKSDKTPEMILKLSSLLDYILYQIEKPKVLLVEELKHIEAYIALEKMRFQEALNITYQTENVSRNVEIAPMLLLPFVENSFKHGKAVDGILTVDVFCKTNGNTLYFNISNDIKNSEKSRGIGLDNIQKRLMMLYPKRYELEINEQQSKFEVSLKIVLNEKD